MGRRAHTIGGLAAALWCVAVLVASETGAKAAEWALEPTISARGEYNDNLLLTPLEHTTVWGMWTSPAMKYKYRTERLELEGNTQADFVRYFGEEGLDITNLFFPVAATYRTEHDQWEFKGGFTRDNTLVGELQQTGVRNQRTQRNVWSANPSWTHKLTENLSVQAGYGYNDVSYDDAQRFFLFDYTTHTASGSLLYQLTERNQATASYYYMHYQAPQLGMTTAFNGGQLGLTRKFSETLTGSASVGLRVLDSTLMSGPTVREDQDTVWLYNADLTKQFENTRITVSGNRDVYPSGIGFLVRTDHVSLSISHDVTRRLTLSFSGDAYWLEAAIPGVQVPNSNYYSLQPKAAWKWSEWWSVEAWYRYSKVEVTSVDSVAVQNAFNLMLTFNIPKIAVSR
jgi:hypothetical protein